MAARKQYSEGEKTRLLSRIETLMAQGMNAKDAAAKVGIPKGHYYRWKKPRTKAATRSKAAKREKGSDAAASVVLREMLLSKFSAEEILDWVLTHG